ncbi:MAG: hypothetical protein D6808_01455, partial [Candidatus Dadabacteria bacterium]
AFYPYGNSLAWSDNFIFPSLVAYTLLSLKLPFAAVWNFIMVGSAILGGLSVYAIAAELTGRYLPSLVAGAVFLTWPWLSEQSGHPQIQFAFFIPASLSLFISFLIHRRKRTAFALGLSLFLCFLTTVYYAIFSAMLLTVLFILSLLFLRTLSLKTRDLFKLLFFSFVGFCPTLFFVFPYLDVREAFGKRHLYEAYYFAASPLSYVSAPAYNYIYSFTSRLSHAEAHLFPGFIPLLLSLSYIAIGGKTGRGIWPKRLLLASLGAVSVAAYLTRPSLMGTPLWIENAACVLSWVVVAIALWSLFASLKGIAQDGTGRDAQIRECLKEFVLFISTLFFVISLGPFSKVSSFSVYAVFYNFFPGFDSVRALSRVGVLTVLGIALLSSFMLERFSPKGSQLFSFMCLALIVTENFTPVYPLGGELETPPIFLNLSSTVENGASAIVLPYARSLTRAGKIKSWSDFAFLNVNYMKWLNNAGVFSVNGYTGQRTWVMDNFPRKFSGFPDRRSVNTLAFVGGLRYIVVVPRFIKGFDREDFYRRLSRFPDELKVLGEDREGNILIEFVGEIPLRETYYVLVPPDKGRKAELLFKAKAVADGIDKGGQTVNVKAYSLGVEFSEFSIPLDGMWHDIRLPLPKPLSGTIPRKISFSKNSAKIGEQTKVYIKSTRYIRYRR